MKALTVVLTMMLLFSNINSLKFEKQPMTSRKLCNNDPKDVLTQKCYDSQYTKEVECDDRKIDRDQCNEVSVMLETLTNQSLSDIGQVVDFDWTIRRVTIKLTGAKHLHLSVVGELIDSFLLPRPMWSPVVEPFHDTDPMHFVFERYNQKWDPYFKHITQLQFPSAEVCAKSMMVVGHGNCVHPGFSDVRKIYYSEMKFSPVIGAAYVPYVPKIQAFISDEDCPLEQDNRWTCAFLQMTNCTLPSVHAQGGMTLYNSTADGGQLVFGGRYYVDKLLKIDEKYAKPKKEIEKLINKLPPFVYTSPATNLTKKFHGPDENQMPEFLFMEFLFRKNAFYRMKVADHLAKFRAKYGLGNTIRTKNRRFVAVQIRRGDRQGYASNMTEFCHNLLIQKFTGVSQNCTYGDGEVKPCTGNEHVLGCDKLEDIPIGDVTLDAAIRDAEVLIDVSVRNMIIFSDDMEWVNHQLVSATKDHPEWKFFTLDSPLDEKVVHRMGGTGAGVYFHATIDLVQECDALLGHFTSGVPMTFAGAMCHHHAGMEGICPPVYNLKNRLN